jgi:hypothetical protein
MNAIAAGRVLQNFEHMAYASAQRQKKDQYCKGRRMHAPRHKMTY